MFCLDTDTPRNVYLTQDDVRREIKRGRDELNADKIILSGGEGSIHPKFIDFVRYARDVGYSRVQTVTNGYMFSKREFYVAAVEAGLGEITFSLHGHTPELHDRLTGTPGAFHKLMKGMMRAVRDGRIIVNVDVCINKQNVPYIDQIVALCLSVGVREFDLLHVIPQGAAFQNRDELFYDPIEHLRKKMLDDGTVDEARLKTIDREVKDIVSEAAAFAQESPEPDPSELHTDVLAAE